MVARFRAACQGQEIDRRACQHFHHKRTLPGVCTLTINVRKDLGIETLLEKWYIFVHVDCKVVRTQDFRPQYSCTYHAFKHIKIHQNCPKCPGHKRST